MTESILEEAAFRAWCGISLANPNEPHSRKLWAQRVSDRENMLLADGEVLAYAELVVTDERDKCTAATDYSDGYREACGDIIAKLTGGSHV